MSTASTGSARSVEQSTDLLILDEHTGQKYALRESDLLLFVADRSTWSSISDSTVIVDLTDDPGPLAIPSLSREKDGPLSLLLRDASAGRAYFITPEALATFEVPALPYLHSRRVVRVTRGGDAVERLHPLQRALLQSSTY